MPVKLSKPSKMPCKTWSLQAGDTCPGSINPVTKEPQPVCAFCYAKDGFYNMPGTKKVRNDNREDWKRPEWVAEMVQQLDTERYFRWFDSGDVYHPALAFKIYLVMQMTPWCRHWLPTKSYNIPKIRPILERMKRLDNVSVRYSSFSIEGEYDQHHGSTVIPYSNTPTNATICDAYERNGKCGFCRNCWDKTVDVIAYPAHGIKMMATVRRAAKKAA